MPQPSGTELAPDLVDPVTSPWQHLPLAVARAWRLSGGPSDLLKHFRFFMSHPAISIVVHGGAWAVPDIHLAASRAGVQEATSAGWDVLSRGGSALDAVEATVRVLERIPVFDAGIGSVLNANREVECDALIVDGTSLRSGAVIGLNNCLYPVSAARRLMELTPHAIVAGAGAREFVQKTTPVEELCDESILVTPAAVSEWEAQRTYGRLIQTLHGNPTINR